jgi:hypothetical protein
VEPGQLVFSFLDCPDGCGEEYGSQGSSDQFKNLSEEGPKKTSPEKKQTGLTGGPSQSVLLRKSGQ